MITACKGIDNRGTVWYKWRMSHSSQSADLSSIRVLYRDTHLSLWGIPYNLRPDQQPKDISSAYRSDWIWLGSPGWWGNMPPERRIEVERWLSTVPYIPGNPYEWEIL